MGKRKNDKEEASRRVTTRITIYDQEDYDEESASASLIETHLYTRHMKAGPDGTMQLKNKECPGLETPDVIAALALSLASVITEEYTSPPEAMGVTARICKTLLRTVGEDLGVDVQVVGSHGDYEDGVKRSNATEHPDLLSDLSESQLEALKATVSSPGYKPSKDN